MNIYTHILQANKKLIAFKDDIKKEADKAIRKVVRAIPIKNVDIVFYANNVGVMEHLGLGGRCIGKNLIMIALDPSFPDLRDSLEKNIKRILAHELYHCLRKYRYGGKYTLLQSLVNEGLADHFDIEINQEKPQLWDTALNEKQIDKFMQLAKKAFNSFNYDHRSWFFESKDRRIPRWTGYTLGFKLVEMYLTKNPDKKPSSIYNINEKAFVSLL